MPIVINQDKGAIIIDNHVIATIAGVSAMESYGIVGMASRNAADGLFELLKFENLARGIEVIDGPEGVSIKLHVIIEYGVRISTVAQNVIDRVHFNLASLTDIEIEDIEVLVEDVRLN